MEHFIKHCKALIAKFPDRKSEIIETYSCTRDEAEDGSEEHEIDCAMAHFQDEGLVL